MGVLHPYRNLIQAALRQVFADGTLVQEITYKKYASQTHVGSAPTVLYTDVPKVKAAKLQHNQKSIKMFAGEIEAGDVAFLLQPSDSLVFSALSKKDRIEDASGTTYAVKDLRDVFGLAILVTV